MASRFKEGQLVRNEQGEVFFKEGQLVRNEQGEVFVVVFVCGGGKVAVAARNASRSLLDLTVRPESELTPHEDVTDAQPFISSKQDAAIRPVA